MFDLYTFPKTLDTLDLVLLLNNTYTLCLRRKHVWRNFCLAYHNDKLFDDNAALQDFGIRNNSQVFFIYFFTFIITETSSRKFVSHGIISI